MGANVLAKMRSVWNTARKRAIPVSDGSWEDSISLNSGAGFFSEHIGPAAQFAAQDDGSVVWDRNRIPLDVALSRDKAPLPSTEAREGYYGPNHFNYWASGLRDYCEIAEWLERNDIGISNCLDIGCASGRLIRAFDAQGGVKAIGCDINRRHVDWVAANLPPTIAVFQNHSIPSLPLAENSIDLVTAFSVFTHVEAFDTTWLMEINRILRPGGIAWLTIHGDRTWKELRPDWPLYGPLDAHPGYGDDRKHTNIPRPRIVYRWHKDKSYSANVFYSYEYIKTVWGRILDIVEIRACLPPYQDAVVLRKHF
jgi:SAM-dependent methyltransferase